MIFYTGNGNRTSYDDLASFSLSFFTISGLCDLKFGLSEKHTKFEKNLPHGFDKSVDLLSKRQNHEEDFFKLCVLFKKSEI